MLPTNEGYEMKYDLNFVATYEMELNLEVDENELEDWGLTIGTLSDAATYFLTMGEDAEGKLYFDTETYGVELGPDNEADLRDWQAHWRTLGTYKVYASKYELQQK